MRKNVRKIELGIPQHFVLARDCLYRRSTVVTNGKNAYVVSSVGLLEFTNWDNEVEFVEVSPGCLSETLCFECNPCNPYYITNTTEVSVDLPFRLTAKQLDVIDNNCCMCLYTAAIKLSDVHDNHVAAMINRLQSDDKTMEIR